jgi:hypothetical protein
MDELVLRVFRIMQLKVTYPAIAWGESRVGDGFR